MFLFGFCFGLVFEEVSVGLETSDMFLEKQYFSF